MARSIRDVLVGARQRLVETFSTSALREANLLMAHTLGWTEVQLLCRDREPLPAAHQRSFESLLKRRLAGEPVAYIIGEKEFFGRPFYVDERVLIPRPETEHLVESALDLPLPRRPILLDLGTGSGCLALTLALELPASRPFATDRSPGAVAVALRNARRHGLEDRVRFAISDLATALKLERFDLVVSNPPYIGLDEIDRLSPEIRDFEPHEALFADLGGKAFHRRLLAELVDLRSGCWLILEIGSEQGEAIRHLSTGSPFACVAVQPDYASHPRVAVLRRR